MTVTEFLEGKTIVLAYTGREHGCRCGCHGNYFDPGTRGFTRAVNKAKKLNFPVREYDKNVRERPNEATFSNSADGYWLDLYIPANPHDKTITLYTTK